MNVQSGALAFVAEPMPQYPQSGGQFVQPSLAPVGTGDKGAAPPVPPPAKAREAGTYTINVEDPDAYAQGAGDSDTKVKTLISQLPVVVFSRSHCPFCLELKRTLDELAVQTYVIETDQVPGGGEILASAKRLSSHKTVPMVYIKGKFMGGCDDVKAAQTRGELSGLLAGLKAATAEHATSLDTIQFARPIRGQAVHPLFWFPNVVNNYVVRMTGLQVTALCAISVVLSFGDDNEERWAKWISAFLLFDFGIRFLSGASLSPLGMIAMLASSPLEPQFKPGPPKQFASFCGVMFSGTATILYFTGHEIPAVVVLCGLMGAAGMEGFLDFCLGCVFYGLGIRFKMIPPYVYRIYTNVREETVDGWKYENLDSGAPRPQPHDADPSDETALKYKVRTDEWTKDDFHFVRNMQVTYFAMPLSLAGLAVAFKLAAGPMAASARTDVLLPETYFHIVTCLAAAVFVIFFCLYVLRLGMYMRKCSKEWDDPMRSPSFGAISLFLMLFAFLIFDLNKDGKQFAAGMLFDGDDASDDDTWEWFARILYWIGSLTHIMLTIAKLGEWVGKRLEMEHFHATWMMLPVGCLVAALVAPVIPAINDGDGAQMSQSVFTAGNTFDSKAFQNLELSRFYYSIGYGMWIVLFVTSFFKIVTTHNSDDRVRHATWIWIAAPALISVVDFNMCVARGTVFDGKANMGQCTETLSVHFFFAIIIFLGLCWATLPYINHFGRDKFGMNYWIECFAADTLAVAAAVYYSVYGTYTAEVLMVLFLVVATTFNFVATLWTLVQVIRRRTVFCPEQKWGPLSFMKLTHEAMRAAIPNFQQALTDLNAAVPLSIQTFAALFQQFVVLHEEHSRHEDEIIFKTFNDFFAQHARKFNDDHEADHKLLDHWKMLVNTCLATQTSPAQKQAAIQELQQAIPPFVQRFLEHLQGEEDHLNPIGKRYIPLDLQKQISRRVWEITPASRWEIIVPYLVNNLPRNPQRVRYLKCLTWALPERAQQIGAIVYRNVDAVKWEMIRIEIPEIVPRGTFNWRRYY